MSTAVEKEKPTKGEPKDAKGEEKGRSSDDSKDGDDSDADPQNRLSGDIWYIERLNHLCAVWR